MARMGDTRLPKCLMFGGMVGGAGYVGGQEKEYGSNLGSTVICRGEAHRYVCAFSPHLFWTLSSLDVSAEVTQEEGHTGFLIHLPPAVRALLFLAGRIQLFLSLVDREVEFCVLTI